MTWSIQPDGAGGRCLKLSLQELAQFEYVSLDVRNVAAEELSVLHFRARADEGTPLLGVEIGGAGNSRWKLVLPLSTQWREYTVFIPSVLSYATEGRGGPGDYLHPGEVASLHLGYTRAMVGPGEHVTYVDDVELGQWQAPAGGTVHLPWSAVEATTKAYGDLVKTPEQPALARLFGTAQRCERATVCGTGQAGVFAQGAVLPGAHDGWVVCVAEYGPADPRTGRMARQRRALVHPLLVAGETGELGPVASVVTVLEGEPAGARMGFLALDTRDVLASWELKTAVLETISYLARRPTIVALEPEFGVVDGQAAMTVRLTAQAPADGCAEAKVQVRVEDLDGKVRWRERFTVALGSRESREFPLTVPAPGFDWKHYRIVGEVSGPDGVVDRETLAVDTAGVMRRLCDFFVEAQREDGAFSGHGYVDERAARGLLAMYETTGDEPYRVAAVAWGELELREQREDGGYRMGYGITKTGEECFVADGGEIAIGMARLVKYVPPHRRQTYVDSLRRYFDYREGFRLPDGRIAVGWVMDSQYTQQGGKERLEKEVRSDKSFDFVAGCTLASASALHHITGNAADRDRALRDARWFLDDGLKAVSVYGEGALWAHYHLDDAPVRAQLAARMKETLLPYVAGAKGWWYASAGRSAVTLEAVAYYFTQVEPLPEALAALMRGMYHMVCDGSASGLPAILEDGPRDASEWRYLCYSSVSLAEVLEPLVTLRDIAGK